MGGGGGARGVPRRFTRVGALAGPVAGGVARAPGTAAGAWGLGRSQPAHRRQRGDRRGRAGRGPHARHDPAAPAARLLPLGPGAFGRPREPAWPDRLGRDRRMARRPAGDVLAVAHARGRPGVRLRGRRAPHRDRPYACGGLVHRGALRPLRAVRVAGNVERARPAGPTHPISRATIAALSTTRGSPPPGWVVPPTR